MKNILLVFLFFLTNCTEHKYKFATERYDIKVTTALHKIFLYWGLHEKIPQEKERMKLNTIFNLLKEVDDVEITLMPIFDLGVSDNLVHSRLHIIKEKLINFGVATDKIIIAMAHRQNSKQAPDKSEGIKIIVKTFKMKVPHCETWQDTIGNFDTGQDMPNFGCSTAHGFAKMIANPSSIVKYRKTEHDPNVAVASVENFISEQNLNNASSTDTSLINSDGMNFKNPSMGAGGMVKPTKNIGNNTAGIMGGLGAL